MGKTTIVEIEIAHFTGPKPMDFKNIELKVLWDNDPKPVTAAKYEPDGKGDPDLRLLD